MSKLLSRAEMDKLTTKRLLAYRDGLYRAPEGPDTNDYGDVAQPDGCVGYKCVGGNKSCILWKETFKTLKEILAGREHVIRKP